MTAPARPRKRRKPMARPRRRAAGADVIPAGQRLAGPLLGLQRRGCAIPGSDLAPTEPEP
jgi:hypothetical protein